MSVLIDLTGKVFGKWTVLHKSNSVDKTNHPKWLCQCICGFQSEILGGSLRGGYSTQCSTCSRAQTSLNKIKDLTGRIFGNWKVLELDKVNKSSSGAKWKCVCKCGQIKSILSQSLTSGCTTRCRICYYQRSGPWDRIYRILSSGAKLRNLSVSITASDLKQLFINQQELCALTGEKLHLGVDGGLFLQTKKWAKENTVSVDRIDSSKGYEIGNIQLVHKDINMLKNNYSQAEFLSLCKKVANHNKDC